MFNPLKGNAMSTTLDGFCHRMVRVGDVNIHAVIGGDGPPLVLLHGFPQTWWAWRKMMPLLAVKRTVVAVDLRGAGDSDSPQGDFDKASLAADVRSDDRRDAGGVRHRRFWRQRDGLRPLVARGASSRDSGRRSQVLGQMTGRTSTFHPLRLPS